MKISPELGENWVYYWAVHCQTLRKSFTLHAPLWLNVTIPFKPEYHCPEKMFTIHWYPKGSECHNLNQRPLWDYFPQCIMLRDCPKFPLNQARCSQEEAFPNSFVSGSSPRLHFPSETRTGESVGGSHPLLYFCRGLWFYLCGVYTVYEKTFQWDWVFIC